MGWSGFQRGRVGASCLGWELIAGMGMRMRGCGGVSSGGRGGGVRLKMYGPIEFAGRETRVSCAMKELELCAV